MKQRKIQNLFNILRSAISGEMLTESEKELIDEDVLNRLKEISDTHDILPILEYGIKQNKLLESHKEKISQNILTAVYRYEQLNYDFEKLCEALETAKIDFIPLKGSVLRNYYPEPWMRTSCDIDILIREEDKDRATDILVNNESYTIAGKTRHDIGFSTPRNKHVELHYSLIEEGRAKKAPDVLKDIWNSASVKEGYNHWYELTDEMFYFYHIAHMAKHFENGGCGLRTFIDLWILDNLDDADMTKRNELLEKGGLLSFANSVRELCKVWFEGAEINPILQQMENYIIRGGVYGSVENRISVQQTKKGGRFKYLVSRVILPYDIIKNYYPILEKHRWLMSIMQIRRWFRLVFCGQAKSSLQELKYSQSISVSEEEKTRLFLESIGL